MIDSLLSSQLLSSLSAFCFAINHWSSQRYNSPFLHFYTRRPFQDHLDARKSMNCSGLGHYSDILACRQLAHLWEMTFELEQIALKERHLVVDPSWGITNVAINLASEVKQETSLFYHGYLGPLSCYDWWNWNNYQSYFTANHSLIPVHHSA